MPVALIVEDGTGVPNANSYVTLDNAANYNAAAVNGAAWEGLTDDNARSALLVRSTRIIDAICDFTGSVASPAQALRWPRAGLFIDGYSVPTNIIPAPLKNAVCELAGYMIDNGDPTGPDDTAALTDIQVGPIKLGFRAIGAFGIGENVRSQTQVLPQYNTPFQQVRELLPSSVFALLLPILGNPTAPTVRLQRT